MDYISTRGGVFGKSSIDILLEGLASDGGLYVPREYPVLHSADLQRLRGQSYLAVACAVMGMFMPDLQRTALHKLLARVYNPRVFGSQAVTPVREIARDLYLLRLSEGPTLAFKDVPLQAVGVMMEHVLRERSEQLNVLAATSGDTGSAAAYALRGRQGIRLFVLSPYGRMSPFQARQMYTLQDGNIFNIAVDAPFDELQSAVKAVNEDAEFKKQYKIGAVNSINWTRIALQVVYYVYAWLQVTRGRADVVQFAVPSGNFGNALSAHIARMMGLPIEILVCTNENDVLHEFFSSGVYRIRKSADVKVTSSPSMDIASASNFERFIYDYTLGDAKAVANFWAQLKHSGKFDVGELHPGMTFNIASGSATHADVISTIRHVHASHGVIIDPHTAVAMKVGLEKRREGVPLVVAETAQPAKFEAVIREALGFAPPVPPAYAHLSELPERVHRMDADPAQLKAFITAHS